MALKHLEIKADRLYVFYTITGAREQNDPSIFKHLPHGNPDAEGYLRKDSTFHPLGEKPSFGAAYVDSDEFDKYYPYAQIWWKEWSGARYAIGWINIKHNKEEKKISTMNQHILDLKEVYEKEHGALREQMRELEKQAIYLEGQIQALEWILKKGEY